MCTKKLSNVFIIASSLLIINCSQMSITEPLGQQVYKSEIARNIGAMKDAGYFDSILDIYARTASSEISEDEKKIYRLINNTDEVIDEIKKSEYAETELQFLNLFFNGGTTEKFSEAFSKQSEEMGIQYSKSISEIESSLSDITNESIRISASNINVNQSNERSIFLSDFSTANIVLYGTYCAATSAGLIAASSWIPWVKASGYVAAAAGASAMTFRLLSWAKNSDFTNLITSVIGKDGKEATNILNKDKEFGKKTLLISSLTAVPVVTCICTPFGKSIIGTVVKAYDAIIGKILSVLPPGINYTLWGVPIKKLALPF